MIKVSGYLGWDGKVFSKKIAFVESFKATKGQI